MGVKKKGAQVTALTICHRDLETLSSLADVEGRNLASLLLHCAQLSDGVLQIRQIKEIVPLLEKTKKNGVCDPTIPSCLDVLAGIYLSLNQKNPLKKVLASSLNGLPDCFLMEAIQSFTSRLQEELSTTDLHMYRNVMDNLASCLENLHLGKVGVGRLLQHVLPFLQKSLSEISEENRKSAGNRIVQTQLMNDLLVGVRVSVMLVQKLPAFQQAHLELPDSPMWQSMCALLTVFTALLTNDELLQTIQSTCGLAVILFIKVMLHPPEKIPELVSSLLRGSVDCAHVPEWLLSCCGSLCCADVPYAARLFLCQGTLSMLDWKDVCWGLDTERLLLDTVQVLFTLSTEIKESTLEMFLCRILASWTNTAIQVLPLGSSSLKDSLHGGSRIVKRLLEYVYTHWEHPLDALRHQTKVIFRNLLQMHQLSSGECSLGTEGFISELTQSLLQLEWHIRGKYMGLACLVAHVGVDPVLAVAHTIPSQILEVMGDQALVPYASDLLETMFRNHKSHLRSQSVDSTWVDQWHETWVAPLLLILCEGSLEQRSYVIDYYLPKLLDCNPESLSYMVKILQASADIKAGSCESRGALGALMACLRTARAHGHLQSATETWRDLVSGARIKRGLVHQHFQVRMDTLGLLCESNRSTEVISVEEAQWIQFFLTHTLHSQAPGVRQQTCALLKKLFLRVRESSQVLYRLEQSGLKHSPGSEADGEHPSSILHRYKNFMSSICNTLFEALFPGSSYSTRFSALTLLGSIAEVFPAPEGPSQSVYQLSDDVDAGRVQTLVHCFTSTFEDVKLLAFDLVMKLPRSVAHFQDEDMRGLFQAALELSTSTKPYDCVTASYLLALLIWQDALPPELCGDPQPTRGVEGNTLRVIKCLLENLEEEIAQAESSLLRAAASCPLYGRVHCIIGVFQKLSPDLLQLAEWRDVVERLLSASYRLSAVVAPIIQSSSPEGLVPMDTDSESTQRLQRILSEIQPRDSNGYFTQAQVLKGHSAFDLGDLSASVPRVDSTEEVTGTACDVTAQMVLVCCWRSMKEVALLLGTLCQLLPLQPLPGPASILLTEEQVREIGDYFKQHLLQSRHRGAFELAYTGFIKLTETLTRCPDAHLQQLPEHWLQEVLVEIRSSNPSSKLCATRRSAGIPFYIQALLASEPKKGKMTLLKMTMRELLSLAAPGDELPSTVPQVHSLNILRALFRDTRLGEGVIPYVAEGMKAAILGFTSPVWPVRNSSTLLFSTLITRIFGVKRGRDELSKKNRMTGSEFFSRFPELYPFLLKQLEAVSSNVDRDTWELNRHPGMFLLLLVLERLYPSPMDGSCSALSLAPFQPFIMRCGRSPVYRLREMAARALVPFVTTEAVPTTVRALLAKLPNPTDRSIRQNHIHGALLQVLHLLHAFSDAKPRGGAHCQQELATVLVCAQAKVWLAKRQNPCLVTRAVYLDILLLLAHCLDTPTGGLGPAPGQPELWKHVSGILEDSELKTGFPSAWAAPGLPQYLKSLARLAITAACRAPGRVQGRTPAPLVLLLGSSFPEMRLQTLQALGAQLLAIHPCKDRLAALGSDVARALMKLAVHEEDPQCLHQVLSVLLSLDPGQWLPQMQHCENLTPEAILSWTLDIAAQKRSEAQYMALRLASRVLALLLQPCKETSTPGAPVMSRWVQLVVASCGEQLPTESRLAAATALASTAHLLAGPCLVLGLQATLALWRSELALLQSEEQTVRDAASEVVTIALSQETTRQLTDFASCPLDASMALSLALTVLSHLLQIWGQLGTSVPILLTWVLGEDLEECQDEQQGDEDHLFDKDTVNLWAEPLLLVKHLNAHLVQLLTDAPLPPCDPEQLQALHSRAQAQCHLLSQRLGRLPPNAAFLRTPEFTQLRITEERTQACLRLLAQLG
ncbi:tRNA (32-2'-O)-methyltransferase regulator THADA isoform X2 [Erinaceus europaeus]|uniref:tRNA (32-2'-O)-methyltransferase regulator THADA n=1 Tax=Erinaceus europaeus TaxID=9365 RepID=A0ABM3X284_ERIEU|nr:tRNA (32-2'-O)-methyltransferase regulator THADA isoform X2 [Erinaceus europaeus]